MTERDPEAQRRVLHRLRRAQGQLAAVIRAVEDGKPCREVVTQLAATSKALDKAGVALISSAMHECLSGDSDTDETSAAEFEKLFMMLA
ncbi:MAG: metal-sensitive transcriptional regulator [Trueperaceae bacterium]|nr:metal-sensitive transcriptional regulator [Trueperaceae bacterium]